MARLWGRSKIDALEDVLRQGGDEPAIRPAVVALAMEHHLVSRYTSLVAVDRTPVRSPEVKLASVRFDNATPHGALAFAHGGLGSGRQFALAALLALLALALLRPQWAR